MSRAPLPEQNFMAFLISRWKKNIFAIILFILAIVCLTTIDNYARWVGFSFFIIVIVINFLGEYQLFKKRK